MVKLDEELGQLYGQALVAIAHADGEVGPEEGARLRELVAARTSAEIDLEASFFHKITSDELGMAVRKSSQGAYREAGQPVTGRELARALIHDAVALATADGDHNGREAEAILRFARALGATSADIRAETDELDEWLR